MGSAAISAVPVRANTRSTSGTRSTMARSRRVCISTDCVRLVPGMRKACRAKSPSLRLGMNSLPMREASTPEPSTATRATAKALRLFCMTQASTGS
ncbi:hypothetical protein D3C81_1227210 [compost metagenome]